jgi:ferredoxin
MAIVERVSDQKNVPLPDGERIMPAAEELNVTFRCRGGGCGACKTRVVEGRENLSELTKNEKRYRDVHGLDEDERLMCQTRVESGTVVIDPQPPEFDALGRPNRKPGRDERAPCGEPIESRVPDLCGWDAGEQNLLHA